MGASASRKAASTRKGRAAAQKAASTRKRRATKKTRGRQERTPSVIPMISYEDGIRALEWLASAFGFRKTACLTTPDGRLSHGEILREIEEGPPGRLYRAEDLEGHRWFFFEKDDG